MYEVRGIKKEGIKKDRRKKITEFEILRHNVAGIRSKLKQNGIHHCWTRIRNIMSAQRVVTTRMKLENKNCIVLRNVTHPNMEWRIRSIPTHFFRQKSFIIWPKTVQKV